MDENNTPSYDAIAAARTKIAYVGRMLFDRHLTDAAGGNISLRVGSLICISPRYSGGRRQWQLTPDDVLVADKDRNILAGSGQLSRESNVHFRLHAEFGDSGTAVIHAHARNIMVMASLACAMPPALEATRKFGETPVIPYAPAHSPKLAEYVAESLRGRQALIKNFAAAVIAPWHGLFLMARDMDTALDSVERMDTNAYCILMGSMFLGREGMAQKLVEMEDVIGNYKEG